MRLDETIARLSTEMRGLATGDLAELRRMDASGAGVAAYWHLAARCGFLDARIDAWIAIVRMMAVLNPKGEPSGRQPVHDARRRLGAVLCDGGDSDWGGGEARPAVSEHRLGRFLAAPPNHRADSLERFARMLARRRDTSHGLNCADIARLLLFPDDPSPPRDLAREYYRRLDAAQGMPSQEEDAK